MDGHLVTLLGCQPILLPTSVLTSMAWSQVSEWVEGGDYFSVFETPVHLDGSSAGRLPVFDAETAGLSVSFWFKSHKPEL
eukprot:1828330-Rhodomonas_salina.1